MTRRQSARLFVMALCLAGGWWLFGLWLRATNAPLLVWDDQFSTFIGTSIRQPYSVAGFLNLPWTTLLLAPLQVFRVTPYPLELAVLTQWLIYAVALAELARRHGRWPLIGLVIALTSPLALDTAVEINLEWLVALGLLLPPALGAALMLTKPQVAIGWILGYDRRRLLQWVIGAAIVGLLSVLIWGDWWTDWQISAAAKTGAQSVVNAAPAFFIGTLPAALIGVVLVFFAVRRHDVVLGLIAGLFFVPYVAAYSLLIPFTLLSARHPRACLIVSLIIWAVVLSLIVNYPWATAHL